MNVSGRAAILSVLLMLASTSFADTYSVDIDIEGFGGAAGPVFSHDFLLPDVASVDSVSIELSHSWAGDISFSLLAPDGQMFDLTSDNGGSGDLGDGGSLLSGVATYGFVESGGNPPWSGLTGTAQYPAGSYNAESWGTGSWTAGMWNLALSDNSVGDLGAVGNITVTYNPVPEPNGLLATGLCAASLLLRRRRCV